MNTKDQSEINVGVDTGQAILDIYVRPQGRYRLDYCASTTGGWFSRST
jgi:hypothetical protein